MEDVEVDCFMTTNKHLKQKLLLQLQFVAWTTSTSASSSWTLQQQQTITLEVLLATAMDHKYCQQQWETRLKQLQQSTIDATTVALRGAFATLTTLLLATWLPARQLDTEIPDSCGRTTAAYQSHHHHLFQHSIALCANYIHGCMCMCNLIHGECIL